jgi:hypothetical protein
MNFLIDHNLGGHAEILLGNIRLLAEVREQGTGNREQKEELRLKASKTLYF